MPFLVTLHVKLDQPSDFIYRPRDLIGGSVWLRSDVDENVKSVVIQLKAWTTVRFASIGSGGPRRFREDYNLLIIQKQLIQEPQILKKLHVHEWPFEFICPEVSELDLEGQEMGEGAERFELNPHQLPPSLPFDEELYGGIMYELEATLQNAGKGKKPRSRTQNINFRPHDSHLRQSDHIEHHEKTFVSSTMPTQSAGQKFRGFFAWDESNRPLSSSFTVCVDVPNHIYLNELIPVSIRVQHNKESSSRVSVPSVHLHTAKVFLNRVTATRLLNLEKFANGHRSRETVQSRLLDGGQDMM